MEGKKRAAISLELLFWLILGVVVLFVSVYFITDSSEKVVAGIEHAKDLFKWG